MRKEIPPPSRRRELAKACGINPDYLWQCLTGRRSMSPKNAINCEKATGGELFRKDLCHANGEILWPDLQPPSADGDNKGEK